MKRLLVIHQFCGIIICWASFESRPFFESNG